MKILLHSNHKWTEKSFPFILKQLNRAKGFDFATIDRVPAPKVFAPFVPQTNGFNYPDWNWFYETLSKPFETKYDLIVWHEERAFGQGLQTGAERLYNGVYDDQTKDTIFNCVVFAGNKATDRRTIAHHALYPGMTDFERIFIHEVSHGASRFKGVDQTHEWDYEKNDIPGAFDTYDLSLYKPQRTVISLLKQMLELLTKKKITKLTHPVEMYKDMISQAYGVPNAKWYPASKHHIGNDYACPANTKVKAPFNGKITTAGTSKALGNYCHYQYVYNGNKYTERYLHLSLVPELGSYTQGSTIASTGNTGLSTGHHLHQDIWLDEVRLDVINEKNWRLLTVDPQEHYKTN